MALQLKGLGGSLRRASLKASLPLMTLTALTTLLMSIYHWVSTSLIGRMGRTLPDLDIVVLVMLIFHLGFFI